jgi:N utilization substance protein B
MPSRRKARECALQMLFQWDLGKDTPESVEKLFWSNTRWIDDEAVREFASRLFRGTVAQIDEIDSRIRKHAENWRMERMAAVDRNILRVAIHELMKHKDTPPAVVINEALEVASRFSGEDSVHFLNGVLDAVRKEEESGATPEGKTSDPSR